MGKRKRRWRKKIRDKSKFRSDMGTEALRKHSLTQLNTHHMQAFAFGDDIYRCIWRQGFLQCSLKLSATEVVCCFINAHILMHMSMKVQETESVEADDLHTGPQEPQCTMTCQVSCILIAIRLKNCKVQQAVEYCIEKCIESVLLLFWEPPGCRNRPQRARAHNDCRSYVLFHSSLPRGKPAIQYVHYHFLWLDKSKRLQKVADKKRLSSHKTATAPHENETKGNPLWKWHASILGNLRKHFVHEECEVMHPAVRYAGIVALHRALACSRQ